MTPRHDGIPHPRDSEGSHHNQAHTRRSSRTSGSSPYSGFLDQHPPGDPLHPLAQALFETATELDTLDVECAHRCQQAKPSAALPGTELGGTATTEGQWAPYGQGHLPCARIAGMRLVAQAALARLLHLYEAATPTTLSAQHDDDPTTTQRAAADEELAPLPDHSLVNDPGWQAHWERFTHITTPLRARGLMCDVDYSGHTHTVYAFLPDGTYLQISHDLHADGPEEAHGWLVTREREDPHHYQVLYDSIPEQNGIQAGKDAQHGPDLTTLFAAIDAYLDGTNHS